MFYSNDPVRDYENYCDHLERENKKWHEENDLEIEENIEMLECLIVDIKKSDTIEQLEEVLKAYEKDFEYSYENNETLEEIKQAEIENLQCEIKQLQEELEK